MLGMGAVLAPRDFVDVARSPRGLILGLALQVVAIPALALAVGAALPLTVGVAAGLVLVAAVPGGTISNLLTYLGRGNIALSISLTAIATLGSLVTTPLLLRLLLDSHLPADFEMPTLRVATEIGVTLLLPLAIGMIVGARLPEHRERFSKVCIRASIVGIFVMAIGAGGSGRLDPVSYGAMGPVALVVLAICAQLVALGCARTARLPADDRLAVAVEVTVRNVNLALLLKASMFPAAASPPGSIGDGMFFVALLYGGVAMGLTVPILVWHRRSHPASGD